MVTAYLWISLDAELATLRESLENHSRTARELEDKCMTLRDELNSSLAKLAVKQEAMYKLEEAKENLWVSYTVDRDIFAGKLFYLWKFRVV